MCGLSKIKTDSLLTACPAKEAGVGILLKSDVQVYHLNRNHSDL
jgi:hypothetical protein